MDSPWPFLYLGTKKGNLHPGDRCLLYTDGVSEAKNARPIGVKLRQLTRSRKRREPTLEAPVMRLFSQTATAAALAVGLKRRKRTDQTGWITVAARRNLG